MPSPLAHTAVGYLIYRFARRRKPLHLLGNIKNIPVLLLISLGFSLLPDIDAVPGVLTGDFGRFHNNGTHSLVVGFVIALAIGLAAGWRNRSFSLSWFLIALASYELHIIMDFFTQGRGVMLLWPLSMERFQPQIYLFMGLRWSEGLISPSHLLTLVTELVFVFFLLLICRFYETKQGHIR